jgi:hypothetical protein
VRAPPRRSTAYDTNSRIVIRGAILAGLAIQVLVLAWGLWRRDLKAPFAEDMAPFTYLLATLASVLAAVMAMAGSVLILSLTLGTSVQRSHLGSILLNDPDFRMAVTGALVTILSSVVALLISHLGFVSHAGRVVFWLAFGGVLQFAADIFALQRLFFRIPSLLTQETLLEDSLSRVDAAYLLAQERRLLGDGATERGRNDVMNDLIFSFRVYPTEANDPLVTVHDILENLLAQSPASVAASSLAVMARRFSELAAAPHDRVYQLLVTPWLAELRVSIVRRGSPSLALAFFDLWADILEAGRQHGMKGFFANAARPFVTSMQDVARAGLFEGAGGRVLRPLVRVVSSAGHEAMFVGPWAGALISWMRDDAEKGSGLFTRVLWDPVENILDVYLDDLMKDAPILDVLVHGLTGVMRTAGKKGLETGGGRPFALKLALKMRRSQAELEDFLKQGEGPPAELNRARRRIQLLHEPIQAVLDLVKTRPELADAPMFLRAGAKVADDRDGEA